MITGSVGGPSGAPPVCRAVRSSAVPMWLSAGSLRSMRGYSENQLF